MDKQKNGMARMWSYQYSSMPAFTWNSQHLPAAWDSAARLVVVDIFPASAGIPTQQN